MQNAIEKELVKVTKVKGKTGVPRQEFLISITTALQELPDDDWELLSEDAQVWSNAAVVARQQGQEIEDFVAKMEAEEPPAAPTEEEETVVTTAASTATKKKRPTTKAKTKAKTPAKRRSTRSASKANGATKPTAKASPATGKSSSGKLPFAAACMQVLIKNPSISKADMMDEMNKAGYQPSAASIGAYMAQFKTAIRAMQKLNMLKKDLL